MPLPPNFAFSQASLQDYADCPRRFQLRYLLDVRWPVAREDSIAAAEQKAQLGAAFHRMVQQHTVGIPEKAILAAIDTAKRETPLRQWWNHYLQTPPDTPGALRLAEVRLTTPLGGPGSALYRLMARYDLLDVKPGEKAVIVDWKTNTSRPRRALLEKRWQTRVYRYVLVRAGAQLNADQVHPADQVPPADEGHPGTSWKPAQVELVYWFANYPAQPERFPYDDGQYTEDEWALKTAIAEIASRAGAVSGGATSEEWPLTDDLHKCRYCTYRTLCDRAKIEADEPDWEPDDESELGLDIDLEQIAEIEF